LLFSWQIPSPYYKMPQWLCLWNSFKNRITKGFSFSGLRGPVSRLHSSVGLRNNHLRLGLGSIVLPTYATSRSSNRQYGKTLTTWCRPAPTIPTTIQYADFYLQKLCWNFWHRCTGYSWLHWHRCVTCLFLLLQEKTTGQSRYDGQRSLQPWGGPLPARAQPRLRRLHSSWLARKTNSEVGSITFLTSTLFNLGNSSAFNASGSISTDTHTSYQRTDLSRPSRLQRHFESWFIFEM
jgi:hypothetical protein